MNDKVYKTNKGKEYYLDDDYLLNLDDERHKNLTMGDIAEIMVTTADAFDERGQLSWRLGKLFIHGGKKSLFGSPYELPIASNRLADFLFHFWEDRAPSNPPPIFHPEKK